MQDYGNSLAAGSTGCQLTLALMITNADMQIYCNGSAIVFAAFISSLAD